MATSPRIMFDDVETTVASPQYDASLLRALRTAVVDWEPGHSVAGTAGAHARDASEFAGVPDTVALEARWGCSRVPTSALVSCELVSAAAVDPMVNRSRSAYLDVR